MRASFTPPPLIVQCFELMMMMLMMMMVIMMMIIKMMMIIMKMMMMIMMTMMNMIYECLIGEVDASKWFSKKPELKHLNSFINLPRDILVQCLLPRKEIDMLGQFLYKRIMKISSSISSSSSSMYSRWIYSPA